MVKQNLSVVVVVPQAELVQKPQAPKNDYTKPELFAVGQTVELIQGTHNFGVQRDYWNTRYYA